MTDYTPPLLEMKFMLNEVFALGELSEFPRELTDAVLDEAGKFAAEKLAPINHSGDQQGSHAHDGHITTADGFKEAYADFVAGGWNSITASAEHGGQGLPVLLSVAVSEMWSSANMAFALCPLLTQGAVELLMQHGSESQRAKYLQKLVSGEWTGTMCLTESGAGSDVGAVATKALKDGDNYLIKGQKIFITYGDHDFTENIIHMVLARLSDAPAGSRGISLFIVPKFLDDGSQNDVRAISIEHKLGIHASPTAVLAFGDNDGAVGYLVGEENQGLKYMFTMMNNARLAVGVEGVAMAENSGQKAQAYARERMQGGKVIAEYPDVQRMLLTISANTKAMRAFSYYIARCIDLSNAGDAAARGKYKTIVDLLIPVLKSHATDLGFEMSSVAMQVFGGVGYIEETGIAQNLRDARIAMIYEGTNGIQAMDLVMRKIMVDGAFEALIEDLKPLYQGSVHEAPTLAVLEELAQATAEMRNLVKNDAEKAAFTAAFYLKDFGITMGAVMLAACEAKAADAQKDIVDNAAFYFEYLV